MKKTALITGATSGIGEACARKFAEGGYNLILTARREEKLAEIKAQLEAEDVRVLIDDRNEKIGRKIRDNEMKHIPYMLIVGEKEAAEEKVNVRVQGGKGGEPETMTVAEFVQRVHAEVEEQLGEFK